MLSQNVFFYLKTFELLYLNYSCGSMGQKFPNNSILKN